MEKYLEKSEKTYQKEEKKKMHACNLKADVAGKKARVRRIQKTKCT